MGDCVSKEKDTGRIREDIKQVNKKVFGISLKKGSQSQIVINHSPLNTSQFLSQKFQTNPYKPQEINLTFMILDVKIRQEANQVHITYINQKPINIYFMLGGQEVLNNTNLTVEITRIKYVEHVFYQKQSQKQGSKLLIVPSKINKEPIWIILQPALSSKQTLFLIYRFVFSEQQNQYKQKSQSLQWCSLAFDLNDIYGSDNLFKVGAGQQCLVCLSAPANVILTPCRHMCMCMQCAKNYEKSSTRRCPICRVDYRAIIQYN